MAWLTSGALWLHVIAGSWWVLASVTMAVAGGVVNADSTEGREFVERVVPGLNLSNALAAALMVASGVVNLYGAGVRRRFDFPAAFTRVLAVKLGLYALMVAALLASWRIGRGMREDNRNGSLRSATARLAVLSAFIALAGAAAMLLGVWLAGE